MPWPTNSRTTEKTVPLDVLLDRRADVRHPRARLDRVDPAEQRLLGHPQQLGRCRRDRPDRHRHRAVAVEPVELGAHVDRHDVALDQRPLRRDAVHHLLVDRRADRRRIAVIPLERRLGARLHAPSLRRRGRYPASSRPAPPAPQLGENPRHELVDPPQLVDLGLRSADDHASHSRAGIRLPASGRGPRLRPPPRRRSSRRARAPRAPAPARR